MYFSSYVTDFYSCSVFCKLDLPLFDTDDTQTTQEVTMGDKTKQQLQIKTNGIIKRKCVRNFKCKEWSKHAVQVHSAYTERTQ